jgi:hypothetical protein
MEDVYVVEIVDTGPRGIPYDTVVQVAACRMFADGEDFDTVYSGCIAREPMDLGKESLDHIEEVYGITPEELYDGDTEEDVAEGLRQAILGKECTSFDVQHTFGRFLSFEPWDTARELTLLPSFSSRIPRGMRPGPNVPANIASVYSALCPDDPFSVGTGRSALDLATMSCGILMRLRRDGMFRSDAYAEDVAQHYVYDRSQVQDAVDYEQGYGHDGGHHGPHQRREQAEGQDNRGYEEGKAEQQHEVSLGAVVIPVYLPKTENPEKSRDDAEHQGDCIVPVPGLAGVRRTRPLLLALLRSGLGGDLPVAFGAGYRPGGHQLTAEWAIPVGHLDPS